MSKTITVSDELKSDIDKITEKEGHQSIDSLIRVWKLKSEMYDIWKNDIEEFIKKKEEAKKRREQRKVKE